MGNAPSFSFRPAVDTVLRISRAQLGPSGQVVLVLDESSDIFVLVADVASPATLQSKFQWFKVQGQTGFVTRMQTQGVCDLVARSRKLSSNVSFLGELAQHTRLPTRVEMESFQSLCFNPSPPREQTLTEVSLNS